MEIFLAVSAELQENTWIFEKMNEAKSSFISEKLGQSDGNTRVMAQN